MDNIRALQILCKEHTQDIQQRKQSIQQAVDAYLLMKLREFLQKGGKEDAD